MTNKQIASAEVVLKEYPNSTRWLEGQEVIGVGNLILTNERIVFLHQVALSGEELERMQKLSGKLTTREMIDLGLSLHKKNFFFPLSSVTRVKTGLYSLLPFPRPCLRVFYRSGKKKQNMSTVSFMFTIPLLKGFFQLEIATVQGWVMLINKVAKQKQPGAGMERS